MNHNDPHHFRKEMILKEFPQVKELYGPEIKTLYYCVAVFSAQMGLAYICSQSGWGVTVLLGLTIGPYIDAMILVAMHELSHNLCTGKILYDRLISIFVNIPMFFPISEIFRQHHTAHHLNLGDAHGDVDAPLPIEIRLVGNSSWRKFLWLSFNMFILPIRSLYKVEVRWNRYVVLNWVTAIGLGVVMFFVSVKALVFLFLSLMFSQGLHPANARQLQRHHWDGTDDKALNQFGQASFTYSYYGPTNFLFLNVGYHNEHHDFHRIAWTRLPELKAMVGNKYYPEQGQYTSRGIYDIYNFVFNPNVSLANFYSVEIKSEREKVFANKKEE